MSRLSFFLLFILVLAAGCQSTPANQQAISTRGMVATAHPLVTNAAREVLNQGGNAADAAVAAGFAASNDHRPHCGNP